MQELLGWFQCQPNKAFYENDLPNFRLEGDALDSVVFNGEFDFSRLFKGEFDFSKLDCLFVTEARGLFRGEDLRLPV